MVSVVDLVPSLAQGLPADAAKLELDPGRSSDLQRLLDLCAEAMRRAGAVRKVEAVAAHLIDELRRAVESSPSADRERALIHVELFAGLCVADAAVLGGDLTVSHEWLLRALGVDYAGDAIYDVQLNRLRLFEQHDVPALRADAADSAASWLLALFLHSWRSGDHRALADSAFVYSEALLCEKDFVSLLPPWLLIELYGQRGFWATRYRHEDVVGAIGYLRHVVDRGRIPPDVHPRAELHLVGLLSALDPGLDTEGAKRAERALASYGSHYRPVERFQLLVFSCGGDAACLRARLPDLLDELASFRAESEADTRTASERFYSRGQSFQMLGPTVADLAAAGCVGDAVRLLAAWTGDPDVPTPVQAPLLAVLGYSSGALWATEGAVLTPTDCAGGGMGEVVAAANRFLNTTIIFRGEDFDVVPPAGQPGVPDPAFGDQFASAVSRHLRADALNGLAQRPRNLVALPGLPIPVQAVLVRDLGWAPALSVSLREHAAPRSLDHVVLLGDGETDTSTWELDVVEEHFTNAGAEVRRVASTRNNFETAYVDPEVDVLWLASHALFDHYRPDASELQLNSTESLGLNELAELQAPAVGGQRLLVLNTCDAGMSATLGGLAGFGLGPALAAPEQAVISNLWAAYSLTAASFGIELAAHLARGTAVTESFVAALSVLGGGQTAILSALAGHGPQAAALRAAITSSALPYDNIECWGVPTLMT